MDATAPGTYHPRGTSSLQRLFRAHFPELLARYDPEFAVRLGKYRQQRIANAVERFLECGDYSKGIATAVLSLTSPEWAPWESR